MPPNNSSSETESEIAMKKKSRLLLISSKNGLIKTANKFSKPQLAIFVLAFAAIGFVIYRSFAAGPLVASVEAEQMALPANSSVITDSAASGGQAIQMLSNGTATHSVSFSASVSSLTVIARGDQCSGAPAMNVAVDGTNLITSAAVSATAWTGYSATPPTPISSGTHTLSIAFTNDYSSSGKAHGNSGKPSGSCNRNLYIDVSNFFGALPASTSAVLLEAENMSSPGTNNGAVYADPTASGGYARSIWADGTTSGSVSLPSPASSVTVVAQGSSCNGSWPTLTVALDGTNIFTTTVASTAWTSYVINSTPAAGTHTLALTFSGDTYVSGVCDVNLNLDTTKFAVTTTPSTPPPTVTLSASPTSLAAGQAATLTWSSTNAAACTASGAWSGSQPTSGSVSTGALNQNSTYSLTCTGLGGSATATATVSVTASTTASSGRWFADTSYINTVVPTAPTLDPNNSQYQQAIKTATYIWTNGTSGMGGAWSTTVYHSTTSTPLRTISLTVPYSGSYTVTIPYATGWEPSPDSDGHMSVIMPDGNFWEFQGMNQAVTSAHSAARHSITGNAINTTIDAISPTPTLAGLIRPEDIAAGVINHGIRAAVPFASNQVRSPAIWSDGNYSGGPPTGAHLWLPRNADLSSLTDPYQKMVAKAMQEYGIWIGDSGGSFAIPVQSTWDNNASYPFANLSLPQQIVTQLEVLAQ
jgi:hypothetical protein